MLSYLNALICGIKAILIHENYKTCLSLYVSHNSFVYISRFQDKTFTFLSADDEMFDPVICSKSSLEMHGPIDADV